MRKFIMLSILLLLPLFLCACSDEKKVENGTGTSLKPTPAQEAFTKETMKGLDELKGLSKQKAKDVPR